MPPEPSVLTFLVLGIFAGALYGLLAIGIVLVYKGARVFNFAQGEFGTVAAFVTYVLITHTGLPYPLAIVLALVAAIALGLIVERLVIRPLFNASRITLLVATVGVTLLLIRVLIIFAGSEPQVLPPLVGGDYVVVFGAAISVQQLVILVVLGVTAILLALFFSRTNLGLAVLATSQDPLATRMMGISVVGMSRFIWGFAAFLAGVAAILQAGIPGNFFYPGFMTVTVVVPAFTAAVLGGMTSLPGAFLGGLLIGVIENVGIFYLGDTGLQLPGPSNLTLLVVLLLVLLVRPRGLLGSEA